MCATSPTCRLGIFRATIRIVSLLSGLFVCDQGFGQNITAPLPTLVLKAGWNLVGNSSNQSFDPVSAFGALSGRVNAVWRWNGASSSWEFYSPLASIDSAAFAVAHGYGALNQIGLGEGFWVNLAAGSDLSVTLPHTGANANAIVSSSPVFNIAKGWSLLGNNANRAIDVAAVFGSYSPQIESIWHWNSGRSSWDFYTPSATVDLASYAASRGFGVLSQIPVGDGFWVNATSVMQLTLPALAAQPSMAAMTVSIAVPPSTPATDTIWLRTGIFLEVDAQEIQMTKVSSGPDVFQASISAPEGTVLRYALKRNMDWLKTEAVPLRPDAIAAHHALVLRNGVVRETVAQWDGLQLATGSTGTLTGRVTSLDGRPLMGLSVSAGPHRTTTRWDGTYKLQGVPAGPCEITVFADSGEYVTTRASATVSATGTTIPNIAMAAATMADVTIQVTLPAGTPSGAIPRIFGDSLRLGMVVGFHTSNVDYTRMIDMTLVNGASWSYTTSLGIGSCFNYTYTLAYGGLNNERDGRERDANGRPVLRSFCVTGPMTIRDTVTAWKTPQQVPVTLSVSSPAGSTSSLYVATDDYGNNSPPMKMWATGPDTASYVIYTSPNSTLRYRYLRDGVISELIPPVDQDPPVFRSVSVGPTGATANDSVTVWGVQMRETPQATVQTSMAGAILPRTTGPFETGVEFIDYWRPAWLPLIGPSVARLKSKNAKWLQIASVWDIRNTDNPIVEQGGNSFPTEDLLTHIREIKRQGLKVALKAFPFPIGNNADYESVFLVPHSNAWYDQFYDQMKAAFMYHATLAQQEGVDLLILANNGWAEDRVETANPATRLYINAKWKDMIASIRAVAPSLKLTIDSFNSDASEYDWYGDLDYLGDKWWWPVASTDNAPVSDMYSAALSKLASKYKPLSERFGNKPFVFGEVAYYSANTSAMQQYRVDAPEIAQFSPTVVAPVSDYDEQARAYQATLLAFAATPWVQGCYSFGYEYFNMDNKAYSIRSKTAEEILSQVYQQLNGM